MWHSLTGAPAPFFLFGDIIQEEKKKIHVAEEKRYHDVGFSDEK